VHKGKTTVIYKEYLAVKADLLLWNISTWSLFYFWWSENEQTNSQKQKKNKNKENLSYFVSSLY
jgi:hypothetical protein